MSCFDMPDGLWDFPQAVTPVDDGLDWFFAGRDHEAPHVFHAAHRRAHECDVIPIKLLNIDFPFRPAGHAGVILAPSDVLGSV